VSGTGRDDTRWSKVGRELAAEWALVTFEPELAASADLNERYDGRWHVWFVAQGTDTVEWLARRSGTADPPLSAPTTDQLVALIEQASR
jgi:hypothetical protein